MPGPKNQHWLPQFYLRRFAVPGWREKKNAKIWVTDTENGLSEKRKVREVGAKDFLYSHIRPDGSRCFRIEDKLAGLETMIASLYPRISEGFPDLSRAWGMKKLTALFISTLMLRHPDREKETHEMHRRMVSLFEQARKDSKGRPEISHVLMGGKEFEFDATEYEEYKAADENRLKQCFAEQIAPVGRNMALTLFQKRWAILCVDEPVFFTSDQPVIQQHFEKTNFGIGSPGVNIWFPISPRRMLWMTDRADGEVDGFYTFPISETPLLNAFTISNATRFVLSHEEPDAKMRAVSDYADEARRKHGPPSPLEGPIW